MSAEPTQNGMSFTVPDDAPEAPKTLRTDVVPNPHYPPEIESAQLQQIAASQARAAHAAAPEPDDDDEPETPETSETSTEIGPAGPEEDVERLLPDPNLPFALEADGTLVTARHLRLREFLSMLKIVTRGASLAMGTVPLNVNDANFSQSLIMLFVFAIPEAPDEASEFVRAIIDPAPPEGGWATPEDEVRAAAHLDELMINPDLGDLVQVIETVIRKEGPDIRRLGKRLTDALALVQRTTARS